MYFLNPRTLKAEDELSLSVQGQPELHSGFQTSPGYLLRSYLKQQQQKVCGGVRTMYYRNPQIIKETSLNAVEISLYYRLFSTVQPERALEKFWRTFTQNFKAAARLQDVPPTPPLISSPVLIDLILLQEDAFSLFSRMPGNYVQ